jgi:hypothetical protein
MRRAGERRTLVPVPPIPRELLDVLAAASRRLREVDPRFLAGAPTPAASRVRGPDAVAVGWGREPARARRRR